MIIPNRSSRAWWVAYDPFRLSCKKYRYIVYLVARSLPQ
jgi:hypothetical protein